MRRIMLWILMAAAAVLPVAVLALLLVDWFDEWIWAIYRAEWGFVFPTILFAANVVIFVAANRGPNHEDWVRSGFGIVFGTIMGMVWVALDPVINPSEIGPIMLAMAACALFFGIALGNLINVVWHRPRLYAIA